MTYTSCRDCGTLDRTLLYRSGRMQRCHDCQHYENLTRKATGGGVEFTRAEFIEWKRGDPANRRCAYCGISREDLYRLQVLNVRNKKPYEVIGVDRKDNALPYRLANLVPCCGPCNAIKGGILTHEEMRAVGAVLAGLWRRRLDAVQPLTRN